MSLFCRWRVFLVCQVGEVVCGSCACFARSYVNDPLAYEALDCPLGDLHRNAQVVLERLLDRGLRRRWGFLGGRVCPQVSDHMRLGRIGVTICAGAADEGEPPGEVVVVEHRFWD